jgi:hypothetical protein
VAAAALFGHTVEPVRHRSTNLAAAGCAENARVVVALIQRYIVLPLR